MELGEPDASGRRRPIVKEGSQFDMALDCVIMALGTSPNPLIRKTTEGLEYTKKGASMPTRLLVKRLWKTCSPAAMP